jgi:hypothetical protein
VWMRPDRGGALAAAASAAEAGVGLPGGGPH